MFVVGFGFREFFCLVGFGGSLSRTNVPVSLLCDSGFSYFLIPLLFSQFSWSV